ncbi:MAG TPA: phosphodiester glycosidase family protein, partial [Abditibacterium sp.]
LPIRDLNGWPDKGRVTALTRRFAPKYTLSPGEIAVVVRGGAVVSKPGSGVADIPEGGFTLVASGGARPYLDKIVRGEKASLSIRPIGWPQIQTALGGGPRLVKNSKITVTSENFRADVRHGAGPRTAFGVDAQGRYIILIADGRQKFYSTGLTLHELAATMQRLGAVDALNLDGGGSTAMAVKGKLVNRPSDGRERGVANALLVMR